MPIDDSRALPDPGIGRIDDLRKILVRYDAFGQLGANATDDRTKNCDHA
jgi:hypothetical protein